MEFQDYYQTLGVNKNATQKEIQTAYRKIARKMHPDVNKEPGAESRFKGINEAYEVLKDPEKRQKYDQLGANWRQGDTYSPPPGWENVVFGNQGGFDFSFSGGNGGQFSDFFEALFGRPQQRSSSRSGRSTFAMRGADQESNIELTLEEIYHGTSKIIHHQGHDLTIKIQPGTPDETRIRLAGQGTPGIGGGPAGDLYLKVMLLPHPRFMVDGPNLTTELPLSPWEAALGCKIEVSTLDGKVTLTVPPGMQSGQKLRLRGKGLPRRGGSKGDLYTAIKIMVPRQLTDRERDLLQELADVSAFNPRQ